LAEWITAVPKTERHICPLLATKGKAQNEQSGDAGPPLGLNLQRIVAKADSPQENYPGPGLTPK
jgi:hypothetical protein